MIRNWILVALVAAGLGGCAAMSRDAKEKKEKDEVKLTMDQLPAAVKATLTKEAGSGKIGDVAKESEDGKTIYEADVTVDGKEWELKIADDGKLISKKIEDDKDEEKDEKK